MGRLGTPQTPAWGFAPCTPTGAAPRTPLATSQHSTLAEVNPRAPRIRTRRKQDYHELLWYNSAYG
jgi:hypothetical protein